jgi:hypothetical protein
MAELEDRNAKDTVSEALAAVAELAVLEKKTSELRGAAIAQLLAKRKQMMEKFDSDLKLLGYDPVAAQNGNGNHGAGYAPKAAQPDQTTTRSNRTRFRDLILAEVAKILLSETPTGILHGAEIERLAKAGGFTGGTQNFQNYLPVALKRAGGFENIGRNRWKINPDIAPQRPER